MNFQTAPPNEEIQLRRVSEGGTVEFGVFPVMFGYRVRAGFVGNCGCELDWCAGDDWSNVERLYSLVLAILSQREENSRCFDGLPPYSRIKPFFLDEAFTDEVVRAAGPDLELVKLPRLASPRGVRMDER